MVQSMGPQRVGYDWATGRQPLVLETDLPRWWDEAVVTEELAP